MWNLPWSRIKNLELGSTIIRNLIDDKFNTNFLDYTIYQARWDPEIDLDLDLDIWLDLDLD